MALGFPLFFFPDAGAVGLVWYLGAYAVVFGILMVALGWRLRTRQVHDHSQSAQVAAYDHCLAANFLAGIVPPFGVSQSMRKKQSAGILLYRIRSRAIQVLLVHPGGPFWAKKDDGAWSIPKGEHDEGIDALEAAKREFHEETGFEIHGETVSLMPVRQPSGKVISIWAVDGDLDATSIRSISFRMEWPPKSGKLQEFPEVDRAEWFDLTTAHRKILQGQRPFLAQLEQMVQKEID